MGHMLQIKSWIKQKGMNFDHDFRLLTLLFFFPLFLGEKRKGKRITKVVVNIMPFEIRNIMFLPLMKIALMWGIGEELWKDFLPLPLSCLFFPSGRIYLGEGGGHKIIWIPSRREIAPTNNCTHLLRNVLNLFVCIIFNYFL